MSLQFLEWLLLFGTGNKHKKRKVSKQKHKDVEQPDVAFSEFDNPDISGERSRPVLLSSAFGATEKYWGPSALCKRLCC